MKRRQFLIGSSLAASVARGTASANDGYGHQDLDRPDYSDYSTDPRPDVDQGTCTAGALEGPVFSGFPVVSGPAPDSISVLQPLQRTATGHLEYSIDEGPWQRVDDGHAGLLPLSDHVLKFRLPQLPPGKDIRYRIVGQTVGWIKVRQFYHGEIKTGGQQVSGPFRFRTLDPKAISTRFAIWNDTHENDQAISKLQKLTTDFRPDFLLWNGDQSNDCHFATDMAGQFLNPAGLSIADAWPLAYVRGNHECRGPAARSLPDFTGSPEDRFYYAFRSGPMAALVMDTGEDKPDNHPNFGGMANFAAMQRAQATWLKQVVQKDWFRSAPYKVLFCHIPLWFRHPRWPNSSFDGHRYCRQLWTPTLQEAGVTLVISGHTHAHAWMPRSESQPIAQLVGGGPQMDSATLITGIADSNQFRLRLQKLDGTLIENITLPPNS